jgi:hypothetical protein
MGIRHLIQELEHKVSVIKSVTLAKIFRRYQDKDRKPQMDILQIFDVIPKNAQGKNVRNSEVLEY